MAPALNPAPAPVDTPPRAGQLAHLKRHGTEPPEALCGARLDDLPAPPPIPRCSICELLYNGATGNPALN